MDIRFCLFFKHTWSRCSSGASLLNNFRWLISQDTESLTEKANDTTNWRNLITNQQHHVIWHYLTKQMHTRHWVHYKRSFSLYWSRCVGDCYVRIQAIRKHLKGNLCSFILYKVFSIQTSHSVGKMVNWLLSLVIRDAKDLTFLQELPKQNVRGLRQICRWIHFSPYMTVLSYPVLWFYTRCETLQNLKQGCSNLFLEGHCPAVFSSNPN